MGGRQRRGVRPATDADYRSDQRYGYTAPLKNEQKNDATPRARSGHVTESYIEAVYIGLQLTVMSDVAVMVRRLTDTPEWLRAIELFLRQLLIDKTAGCRYCLRVLTAYVVSPHPQFILHCKHFYLMYVFCLLTRPGGIVIGCVCLLVGFVGSFVHDAC